MEKEKVNELIKYRIGYSKDEEIEELRQEYKSKVNTQSEEDFYYSVMSWWNDGNAPYYDYYLEKNWRDE